MKILTLNFFKKYLFEILLFVLIVPSFFDLVRPGFYSMHDDLQAFRIFEMDECFQDFQIPCRWVPNMGFQYGYPQFNYYPPSVYYLGEIIHLMGFQFIDATKILFGLGFIFGAFGMYLFLKELLGRWPALVGALLYTYAPYKAVDVYVRGAMSEFWALIFFPMIFWSVLKIIKGGQWKYGGYLAVFGGLLLITHNLMPLIFAPIAAVWVFALLLLEKKWRVFPKILFGGIFAIGLAAFFSLPVLFEKEFVHVESIIGGYFDYRMHFVSLEQLFLSNYWGYGSSVWGDFDEMSLSTGQIQAISALAGLFLALVFFKKEKKISSLAIVLSVLALGVLFMVHQKSSFVWEKLPFLAYLQFPWRFLGNSVFLLSILGAIGVYLSGKTDFKFLGKVKLDYILGILLIASLFILYGAFFKGHDWINISDKEKFSGKSWDKQLTISIFDYLPIYAELPPTSKAPELPEILEGNAQFESYTKGSNFQKGNVNIYEDALLRLPLFDFPGMKVFVSSEERKHWSNDCRGQEYCLGLITFKLAPGNYFIEAKLTDTPVRILGNILTLFSIITVGFVIFGKKFKSGKR